MEIVQHFYQRYQGGELSLEEAQKQAAEILLSQKIGKSGYIFVASSEGVASIHPDKDVEGQSFTNWEFVQKIITQKEGYIEYDWQNPGENNVRPKALYMSNFSPWDWIICVSLSIWSFNI